MADIYIPTKPVGVHMHKLRRMVALSDTFRDGCTYAEAWERILYKENSDEKPRPFAVIDHESSAYEKIAGGDQAYYAPPEIQLHLYIERDPFPHLRTKNDQRLAAADWFSGIFQDLVSRSDAEDDPNTGFPNFSVAMAPLFEDTPTQNENSLGLFFWAKYTLTAKVAG